MGSSAATSPDVASPAPHGVRTSAHGTGTSEKEPPHELICANCGRSPHSISSFRNDFCGWR